MQTFKRPSTSIVVAMFFCFCLIENFGYLLSFPAPSSPAVIDGGEGVSGAELLVNENDPVTLTCTPDGTTIVINNVTTSATMFQANAVQRSDAGFYQCLSSATVGSIDSLYLLVACEFAIQYNEPCPVTILGHKK